MVFQYLEVHGPYLRSARDHYVHAERKLGSRYDRSQAAFDPVPDDRAAGALAHHVTDSSGALVVTTKHRHSDTVPARSFAVAVNAAEIGTTGQRRGLHSEISTRRDASDPWRGGS